MPINSSSIPALRVARAVKRRRRAEGGGLWGDVGAAMPEAYGAEKPILDPLVSVPKRLFYDLPKEMVEKSQANPLPGLRREDYTDVPADTSPDPNSPLGGVGVKVPRVGWQPVDPMVGGSLEAASNVMGGTALSAPARAAGEMVAGAGPVRRAAREALDMSPEARAARATEQGFDVGTPRYHGTSKDVDFKKFNDSRHGTWTATDPAEASMYAANNDSMNYRLAPGSGYNLEKVNDASRVLPLYAKPLENPYRGPMPDHLRTASNYKKSQSNWFDTLRREGYDGWEPGGGIRVDFNNANLRGQHAPFDPANEGKSIIFGAGAADKRTAAAATTAEIDRIIEAERNLKGAPHDPATPAGGAQAPEAAGDVGGGLAGPAGRGASLEEAARASARWAGERQPIEGLPVKPQYVEGHGYLQPGPIGKIHDVAEAYMRTHRPEIAYAPPREFRPIDTEHSQAIAKAYDEMKHAPNDPATKAAYEAMIDETAKQYQAIKASGLKIEPIPAGMPDPYAANPRLAAHDVAENNHLWFFPTEGGFGTVNKITSNPLLRKMGEKIGDHEMTANDMFRVVHDYFGHLKEGHGFRAAGEDNAWRSHSAMYSDLARPAMTSETRGQNSWVNYGPHGEKNRTASGVDTVYADQKVGLMPDWTMYDKGQAPPMMYHGSRHDYLRPDLSKLGSGQGEMAYGAGYYGSEGESVGKRYRDMQADRQWTKGGQPVSLLHAYEDMRDSLMLSGFSAGRSEHVADAIGQLMEHGFSPAKIRGMVDREGFEKEFAAALKVAGRYKNVTEPGHLYKWAIEANPNHFLDWESTWGKQTPHVQERVEGDMRASIDSQKAALQKSIKRLLDNPDNLFGGRVRRDRDLFEAQQRLAVLEDQGVNSLTGKDIYKRSGLPAKDQAEAYTQAAQRLNEKGIPGLRYRNISGGADSGVRNFVIFNPETLRLLRKYGVVGIPAAGVARR
jgi:hypothetical protein